MYIAYDGYPFKSNFQHEQGSLDDEDAIHHLSIGQGSLASVDRGTTSRLSLANCIRLSNAQESDGGRGCLD